MKESDVFTLTVSSLKLAQGVVCTMRRMLLAAHAPRFPQGVQNSALHKHNSVAGSSYQLALLLTGPSLCSMLSGCITQQQGHNPILMASSHCFSA